MEEPRLELILSYNSLHIELRGDPLDIKELLGGSLRELIAEMMINEQR